MKARCHTKEVMRATRIAERLQPSFMRSIGCTPRGSCNNTRLLEGLLEGSLKEVGSSKIGRVLGGVITGA